MKYTIKENTEVLELMIALLKAVESSEFEGISCTSVNGKNWFDLRDEVIEKAEGEE